MEQWILERIGSEIVILDRNGHMILKKYFLWRRNIFEGIISIQQEMCNLSSYFLLWIRNLKKFSIIGSDVETLVRALSSLDDRTRADLTCAALSLREPVRQVRPAPVRCNHIANKRNMSKVKFSCRQTCLYTMYDKYYLILMKAPAKFYRTDIAKNLDTLRIIEQKHLTQATHGMKRCWYKNEHTNWE